MTDRSGRGCSIASCSSKAFGRGWCSRHYRRWSLYGDPEHPIKERQKQGSTCQHDGCGARPKYNQLCGKHATRMTKHGTTVEPRERKFWAQVDKAGPIPEKQPALGPCWVWTGYISPETGYGYFGASSSGTRLVHRIAYQWLVSEIPEGKHLDHLCRRRSCLRPTHVEPVTPRENIKRGDQGAFWGYVPAVVPARPKPVKPDRCTECAGEKPIYKRTLCRPCYRKWLKDPSVERPSQRTPEQRFWTKVEKTDSCWLWTATINKSTGYGHFGLRHGVMVQAHRHSYELAHGPIPAGLDVHHTCHVRHCVRPDHLLATTRSENLAARKVRRT